MEKVKKSTFYSLFVFVITVFYLPPLTLADDLEACAIMQKLEDLSASDWDNRCNMTSDIELHVSDRDGKKMTRQIRYFTKCKEEKRLTLAFFVYPPDVKNIGFLSHDYNDPQKEDKNWLYLPSLKRVRRIVSPDESQHLMGIDISQFSGLSFSRRIGDYECRFMKKKEIEIDGVKTWAIEIIPETEAVIEKSRYRKHLFFIYQDNYSLSRLISFKHKEGARIIINFKKIEIIDGEKQYTEFGIKEKQGKQMIKQTNIKFSNMRLNQVLDDKLFTLRMLQKGL